MSVNTVSVLGTLYTVTVKKYDEIPDFREGDICGFCDAISHEIVLCDMRTYPKTDGVDWKELPEESIIAYKKRTLRHEIVHAFFNESGLQESCGEYSGPWAQYEEMIDWWAIQGPKVYQAWKEAGSVD